MHAMKCLKRGYCKDKAKWSVCMVVGGQVGVGCMVHYTVQY